MPFSRIHNEATLRQLLEAVLMLESDLTLPALLQHITDSARSLASARYAALGVLDEEGQALAQFITSGMDADTRDKIGALPQGQGILGLLIVDPRPIRLRDLSEHADSFGFPSSHPPMHSFLGVPIKVRDRVFGNLYLTEKEGADEFTDEDQEAIGGLALAAGIAIDNARLQAEVADVRLLEDRDRIARALHDEVIQRLFATALSLQGTVRLAQAPEVSQRIQNAVDDLDDTIRRIRTSIFNLGAGAPGSGTGLRARVLSLVQEMSEVLGYEPQLSFSGPIDTVVSPTVADELLPTLREALSNVARHARSVTARVDITAARDRLRLVVEDDGQGLGAGVRDGGRGMGNMATRAELLGGDFVATEGTDGGTRLQWQVPL